MNKKSIIFLTCLWLLLSFNGLVQAEHHSHPKAVLGLGKGFDPKRADQVMDTLFTIEKKITRTNQIDLGQSKTG